MAGTSGEMPIVRPMELSAVADKVESLRDAVVAVKRCEEVCTVLANQADAVKNTYCFRTALIVHLFTRVLPMPLPHNHPQVRDIPPPPAPKAMGCWHGRVELRKIPHVQLRLLLYP